MDNISANDMIWLEKDMGMINLALFGDVSIDYLEILPGAIESNVVHYGFDEWIYVLEGELLFVHGKNTIAMRKGAHIYVPRNTVHGSDNQSGEIVKLLSVCNPPFLLSDMNKL